MQMIRKVRANIRKAKSVEKVDLGVSMDCEFGRTPKEELGRILDVYKTVTKPRASAKR